MFLGQEQLHPTLQRTLLAASLRSGARARAEFQRCHLQQDVAALPSNLYQVRNTFIHIEAWLRDTNYRYVAHLPLRKGCGVPENEPMQWGGAGRGRSAQHPVHASRHVTRPQSLSGSCTSRDLLADLSLEGSGSAYKKRPCNMRRTALQVRPGLPTR